MVLHDVVTADQRYQAPDKTAYKAWLAANDERLMAEFQARILEELATIRARNDKVLQPLHKAQSRFFSYPFLTNRDMWIVLDPVITVHPDRVFFECFSRDESSDASLCCEHEMFDHVGEFACGATNIDYSDALYDEFQVTTADDPAFIEEKTDVPDAWVRGFCR